MKLNMRPKQVAFIDFETQSFCPLTTAHKYASHESTRVLTCVVKFGGQVHRLGPYLDEAAHRFLVSVAATHTLVAHNAPFDAAVWELAEGLPEAEWFDTLPCCRAAGLPGKLDDVGKVLTGEGKDKNGKRLIDLLCILRHGKIPAVGPAHKLLLDYNERDVELLEQIYNRVSPYGEPDVITVDRKINGYGVPVDKEYLCIVRDLFERNAKDQGDAFHGLTDGVNPGSPKQVKDWMERMGFKVDGIGKFAIREFLKEPESFYIREDDEMSAALSIVREAMDMRREIVRVGRGKIDSALGALEDDGRVRDQFVYWGAHTGRWSGRDLQLHNMPSIASRDVNIPKVELTYEGVKLAAEEATVRANEKGEPRIAAADILSTMLRHMVRADNLLVADYGAVEARGIAFVADDERMLELFSDPEKSVYVDMGSQIFGRKISKKNDVHEYAFAKALVLGCGYGMSGAKFDGLCKVRNVNMKTLQAAGMKASDAVKVYRSTYQRIPVVWKEYHDAMHAAVGGIPMEAGKCKFYMSGPDMHVELPSTRCIVYRNARIENRVPGYCKFYNMPPIQVPTVVFDLPRMYTGFLYGSKVAENIVQAMCRDFVAHTLLLCEQEGLRPILHVHDEVVCEAPEDKLDTFMEIMSTPPAWAKSFPLLVEGYSGPVWTKQPKGFGYKEVAYLNGRQV